MIYYLSLLENTQNTTSLELETLKFTYADTYQRLFFIVMGG